MRFLLGFFILGPVLSIYVGGIHYVFREIIKLELETVQFIDVISAIPFMIGVLVLDLWLTGHGRGA